jgi:signal transduction histidine kinase
VRAGLATTVGERLGRRERARRALHEVRGPLTAIGLAVAFSARDGRLPAERARAIELELARAARALDELEALASGRWERSGRATQAPAGLLEPVDLAELLADSVEAWRAHAERHGCRLTFRWHGRSARVWGDRVRLAQVSGNLIANAIEHGGGEVVVEGQLSGPPRPLARIVVSDRGPGLPLPVAALARGGRGSGRRPGRGRGLAIATRIVAAHGGRIGAAPSERGAKLVVELPACEAPSVAGLDG